MTLSIGTLSNRRRQPVRVISAVYPVQTREQRRLLARNAGHAGRLVALGVALIITAVAVFSAAGSDSRDATSAGLPVAVPEARSAPFDQLRAAPAQSTCPDVALRSGLCSASYIADTAPQAPNLKALETTEGRA